MVMLDMVGIIQSQIEARFYALHQVFELNQSHVTGTVQDNQIRLEVQFSQGEMKHLIWHLKAHFLSIENVPVMVKMVNNDIIRNIKTNISGNIRTLNR